MEVKSEQEIQKQASELYYRFEKASDKYFFQGVRYLNLLREDLGRIEQVFPTATIHANWHIAVRCRSGFDDAAYQLLSSQGSDDFLPAVQQDNHAPARLLLSPWAGASGYSALTNAASGDGTDRCLRSIMIFIATIDCEVLESEVEQLKKDVTAIATLANWSREDPYLDLDEFEREASSERYWRTLPWKKLRDSFMRSKYPHGPGGEPRNDWWQSAESVG